MDFTDPCKRIRGRLHDLAQPLSALAGLVDLMLMEMDERSPCYREAQLMNQQLDEIFKIVRDVRSLAREATDAAAPRRELPQAF